MIHKPSLLYVPHLCCSVRPSPLSNHGLPLWAESSHCTKGIPGEPCGTHITGHYAPLVGTYVEQGPTSPDIASSAEASFNSSTSTFSRGSLTVLSRFSQGSLTVLSRSQRSSRYVACLKVHWLEAGDNYKLRNITRTYTRRDKTINYGTLRALRNAACLPTPGSEEKDTPDTNHKCPC